MHGKVSVELRITKSNGPYLAKPSNNIKLRLAFQAKLDQMLRSWIQLHSI